MGRMPTYQYDCEKCGRLCEIFHNMSDTTKHKCTHCGYKLTKIISSGLPPKFKGSGFYETDYKNKRLDPGADLKGLNG